MGQGEGPGRAPWLTALRRTDPADALILDFVTSGILQNHTFLLLKPPGLCHSSPSQLIQVVSIQDGAQDVCVCEWKDFSFPFPFPAQYV